MVRPNFAFIFTVALDAQKLSGYELVKWDSTLHGHSNYCLLHHLQIWTGAHFGHKPEISSQLPKKGLCNMTSCILVDITDFMKTRCVHLFYSEDGNGRNQLSKQFSSLLSFTLISPFILQLYSFSSSCSSYPFTFSNPFPCSLYTFFFLPPLIMLSLLTFFSCPYS